MKTIRLLLICSLLLASGTMLRAQSYARLWKQVEQARDKGLPQRVLTLTDKIHRKALAEEDAGQLFKAYLMRGKTQETLTPDSFHVRLKEMEQWVEREENPLNKSILHAILACEYADFMSDNRYALLQRTDLNVEELPADMREWSAGQFFRQVDSHAIASMQPADVLLDASSKAYIPLVEQEEDSRYFHHDMYHLLANLNIDTYGWLDDFRRDSVMVARQESLYEAMIAAYQQRGMTEAVLLASLHYADYRKNRITDALSDEAYLQRLNELLTKYDALPLAAEIYLRKAELLRRDGQFAEALRLCEEGWQRYPAYERIGALENLRTDILRPQFSVYADKTAYPGTAWKLTVNYRNLEGFTASLYRHSRLLSSTHYDLTSRLTHEEATFFLPIPDTLGVYTVRLQPDDRTASPIRHDLFVSRIRLLRHELPDGKSEYLTLDNRSGHPIGGVTLQFFAALPDEPSGAPLAEVTTDVQGRAHLPWQKEFRTVRASKGDDDASPRISIFASSNFRNPAPKREERLTLLTDRSIYRPGQTVYVKGIAYEQFADSMKVLEGNYYDLILRDVNRKELAKLRVQTNEFGSFTADFQLPAVTLNGQYSLSVGNLSSTYFRVEEYKRPTFELTFNPLLQAYAPNDTVWLTGQVRSFSGTPVQDMPLAYTVSRRDYAIWRSGNPAPLSADTLRLDAEGAFTLPVVLRMEAERGVYHPADFRVEATLTTDFGETQSESVSLFVTSRPYSFSDDLAENICRESPGEARFEVRNAANTLLPVDGKVRLFASAADAQASPVWEGSFTSGKPIDLSAWQHLPSGSYRIELAVRDAKGKEWRSGDEVKREIMLFSTEDTRLPAEKHSFLYRKTTAFDEENPALLYFGTSCKDVYLMLNLLNERGERLESRPMVVSDTLFALPIPYQAAYGAGITLSLDFLKAGELYRQSVQIEKAHPSGKLDLKWEVFRNRLRPGQTEEWKLSVRTPQGVPAAAELLATLYDASLDNIYRYEQPFDFHSYHYLPAACWRLFSPGRQHFYFDFPRKERAVSAWRFDRFFTFKRVQDVVFEEEVALTNYRMDSAPMLTAKASVRSSESAAETVADETGAAPAPSLRTDFAETAFFYPQLRTNERGEIAFTFTMPESLTRWNFRGYAHTRQMQFGTLDASVITAKEFMLTPHLPRFLRLGDKAQIAANIANQTNKTVRGIATLTLFNPATERTILTRKVKFSCEAGKNSTLSFEADMANPKFTPFEGDLLGVRIVADGGAFSDGEQHLLPVLSNKEYITETLPLPIRGGETRTFALDSLFNGNHPTATRRRLTVEFTANPAWYAVQALPALAMPQGDNVLSWAIAYYANRVASHLLHTLPHLQTLFEAWRKSDGSAETLRSRLEQNEALKAILLAETPWLMEATTESGRMNRLANLFDENRLRALENSVLAKLHELQAVDGSWSWYKGMPGSRVITTYVAELLTRLPLLTHQPLPADGQALRTNAFRFLHKEAHREYLDMRKAEEQHRVKTQLSQAAMDYLYLLAVSGEAVPDEFRKAYTYLYNKVEDNLTDGSSIHTKARSAIILNGASAKSKKFSADFLASIREHLVQESELGAHFAFLDIPYRWGMLPVPTHVAAMEALAQHPENAALVNEMKLWLLRQKQTTAWNSPVATADAVYALLAGDDDLLHTHASTSLSMAGEKSLHLLVEQGNSLTALDKSSAVNPLGYLKEEYTADAPQLDATAITVEKQTPGIAWGAVYAQYLSPVSDVKQRGSGALSVEKQLYVERLASDGTPSLNPLTAETVLQVGDKVVSRLVIRLDRAMDFLQLTDRRAACLEPLTSLSGYRWNSGLGYYVEGKESGINFFFDGLGKGVYVLEHSCRVAREGTYQDGLATIQCAYAPEYASHSSAMTLVVSPKSRTFAP